MHIVNYLRQGSNVFETYWTTRRGAEPVKTRSKLHHLPLEGRKNVYCRRAFSRTRPLTSVRKKSPAIRSGAGYRVKRPRQPTTQPRSIEKFARDHDRNATL
jgi:hypothetical protein